MDTTAMERNERIDQLMTVLRLMGEAQEASSVGPALKVVAEIAALLTNSSSAGIFVAEEQGGEMRLVAQFGQVATTASEDILLRPSSWVRSRESRFIPRDQDENSGIKDVPEAFRHDAYWVPLVSSGETIGRLVVGGLPGGRPDRTAMEFLRLTAAYASSLISGLRLRAALYQRVAVLTALAQVSHTLSATLDVNRVLNLIVESLARLVDVAACSIMLLDRERQELKIHAAVGVPEDVVKNSVRKVGEGISGRVAATGKTIFLRDVNMAQDGISGCNSSRYQRKSCICVPLKARGELIGVLNVNDKKTRDFTGEDLNLVELFAAQAAVAIDNARVHGLLWKTSVTDGLTQTFVHTYFQQRLAELVRLAAETRGRLAVVMVDLDHFKAVNDQYGHQVGDAVLQGTAALLRRAVRSVDLVARYGGEEFAIVLSEVSPRIALAICERLRRNIEQARFPAGDRQVAITASFGVAMFPVDAQEPTALVEVADRHLYASKQAGRNRVTCSRAVIEMAMSEAPASGATRSDASA